MAQTGSWLVEANWGPIGVNEAVLVIGESGEGHYGIPDTDEWFPIRDFVVAETTSFGLAVYSEMVRSAVPLEFEGSFSANAFRGKFYLAGARANAVATVSGTRASALGVAAFVGRLADEREARKYTSPAIRQLAGRVRRGEPQALDEFWAHVADEGTPIVESIPDQDGFVWLTIVWRGDESSRDVRFATPIHLSRGEDALDHLAETDLWYKTYRVPDDLRATYRISSRSEEGRFQLARDPRNPRTATVFGAEVSVITLDTVAEETWLISDPTVAKGVVESRADFESRVLGKTRGLSVYLPPGYRPEGAAYPLVVLFDADLFNTQIPASTILDNLVHAKKIPPTVAILVGNSAGARTIELACNPAFASFVGDELVPWARRRYNVVHDPKRTVVGGISLGGLAAAYVAIRRPDLFGLVLSQSGSFWWGPDVDAEDPSPESEWLTRQYASAAVKDIKFYLEVGGRETPTMRMSNRHFRDVLALRGYDVVGYREVAGGHEAISWRASVADGLIELLGDRGARASTDD